MDYPNRILSAYQQKWGENPEILVRAPGRINLIGEHTDYNDGWVLPAAIDRAIWMAVGRRTDQVLDFQAFDLNQSYVGSLKNIQKALQGWPNYLLGCCSELLSDGHALGGINVVFGGDIPLGAGLSSSAALECGLLFALNELFKLPYTRPQLARLAQGAENHFVGMNCGLMDMFASLMGQANQAILLDCRTGSHQYIPLQQADTALLLCDTGMKHQLVDSEYNTRRNECEKGVQILQKAYPSIRHLRDVTKSMLEQERSHLPNPIFQRCQYVIEENERVLQAAQWLQTQGLVAIGPLLFASHQGLQADYQVSCPELDFLVDNMPKTADFYGARMVGGGFGGCTLHILKKEVVADFQAFISQKYQQKWNRSLRTWTVQVTDGVEIIPPKQTQTT